MKFFVIIFYLSLLFGCVQNNSPISQEIINLNNKANNHFKNKEYSSAISSFDKLLKIDMANKKEYLYHRGICKSYIGDYGGAKKDLLNALDSVSVNSKYIYQVLAENTIKQFNDTSQALRYINMAYNLDPKDESIIMYKLILMGEKAAMQFTLDSLLNK